MFRPPGYAHFTLKSSGVPLGSVIPVLVFFGFFNPVAFPDVKRILVKTRKKERITDPKNTESGIADPTNHPANFAHLMVIAYPRGQRMFRPTGYAHYTHKIPACHWDL